MTTTTLPDPLEARHAAKHFRSARRWAETLAECRGCVRSAARSIDTGETLARLLLAEEPATIHPAFRCGLAPAGWVGWG